MNITPVISGKESARLRKDLLAAESQIAEQAAVLERTRSSTRDVSSKLEENEAEVRLPRALRVASLTCRVRCGVAPKRSRGLRPPTGTLRSTPLLSN